MAALITLLLALVLWVGFFVLTDYEARRGTRLFEARRARFDAEIARVAFVFAHVDFAAFVRTELRRVAERVGHDTAALSLRAVRAAELSLSRAVRHLRAKRALEEAPRETSRAFVKQLSDFKGHLAETRPVRERQIHSFPGEDGA